MTVERAQLLDRARFPREAKLTLYLERGDDHLAAGPPCAATARRGRRVLLGVDGPPAADRRRATLARNRACR